MIAQLKVAEVAEEQESETGEEDQAMDVQGSSEGATSPRTLLAGSSSSAQQDDVVDLSVGKDDDRLGDLKRDSKGELARGEHGRRHSPRPLARAFSSPLVLNAITRQATPPRPGCATGTWTKSINQSINQCFRSRFMNDSCTIGWINEFCLFFM